MMIGQKEKIKMSSPPFHFIALGHLFERILRAWNAQQIRHLGQVAGPLTPLPLERMVTLTGALNGLLVVRGTREFAAWLRSQREKSPLGRYPEEEVFEELISLFCLYLFHDFWRPHLFQVGPIHPFPSIPRDWPGEAPTATSVLLIDDHRVELRLWLKD
jgi:hypothetical protein